MLAGFTLLINGIFLSIIYFMVIPIMPEKKQPNMVIDKIIPIFVFSPTLKTEAVKVPNDNPANEPISVKIIIENRLSP